QESIPKLTSGQDELRGRPYRLGGGASHALRAAFGRESVITADGGDDVAEQHRLEQPHFDVIVAELVVCRMPVLLRIKPEHQVGNHETADHSQKVAQYA